MRPKKISKEEVLSCASDIIKSEGLEACTIRSLAAHLNVAVGTIYNYFPSHEKLLQETFETSWLSTVKKLEQAVSEKESPEDALDAYVYIIYEEIKSRKGLGAVVLKGQSDAISAGSAYRNIFSNLADIAKEIIKDGSSNKNTDNKTIAMISRWVLVVVMSHFSGNNYPDEIFLNQLKNRFL